VNWTTQRVRTKADDLSPDPVIRLNGKELVETRYVRQVSP
jgi:hypothetical protein